MRPRLVAEREPVEFGDLPPDRQPQVPGVAQLGVRVPGEHVRGEVGAEPVGDAGGGVRLVHHDRHLVPLGRQVGGGRDVAAEADEHVGVNPVEYRPRPWIAPASRAGTVSSCGVTDLGSGTAGISSSGVAAQRHQPGLQAALGAETDHLDAAVGLPKRVGERQSRLDMTG